MMRRRWDEDGNSVLYIELGAIALCLPSTASVYIKVVFLA